MSNDTTYVNQSLPAISAPWLNDVNIATYRALGSTGVAGGNPPVTPGDVVTNLAANASAASLALLMSALGTPASSTVALHYNQGGTGAVTRTVQSKLQETVSVLDFGADPTGAADSAPAVRAAFAAGVKNLFFPDGNYSFQSQTSVGIPPAFNNPNVLISGVNNFTITLTENAVISASNAANYSELFLVVQCKHWVIQGGSLQGNRTGLTGAQENVAIGLQSCVDFVIQDVNFTGDWSADGSPFTGDWLVNGVIRDCTGDTVGKWCDLAFLQNVWLVNNNMKGAGNSSGSTPGSTGFSNVYDVAENGSNNTGVSFTDTNNVFLVDCNISNFDTGCYLASGHDYWIRGGNYSNNPGNGGTPGLGIFIDYQNGGAFDSTGHPVQRVNLSGVGMESNGAVVGGPGLYINGSAITNADLISDIYVRGCTIRANNNIGINASGPTHLANIIIEGNTIPKDATQTTQIAPALVNSMVTNSTPNNASVINNWGFNPQGQVFPALPAGTGIGNIVYNLHSYPVQVTFLAQVAAYNAHIVDVNAAFDTALGNQAAGSGPVSFLLTPGQGVYIAAGGTVPTGWFWTGL